MTSNDFFRTTLGVVLFFAGTASAVPDESKPLVYAEKKLSDSIVRVVEYEEEFGGFVSEIGSRRKRTVLCVEIAKGQLNPRRLWQSCQLRGLLTSLVLSDVSNGQFVFAYCMHQTIFVALIAIDGSVQPLPDDVTFDQNTGLPNWKSSPSLQIPYDERFVTSLGKSELGVDLETTDEIALTAATRTSEGWRIDASVIDPYLHIEKYLSNGTILLERGPPSLYFRVLLDAACKSARIEVRK